MGEFAEAAEAVVSAETGTLETPADTGSGQTTDSTSASDAAPASTSADSEITTDAPPVAAPAQSTATSRDARGRYAGQKPGPPSTIPYDRFKEVTQTAKQRGEEIKALKERFGWIGDQEAPVFKQFWEAYKADPASAFLNELPLLLNSPKYGSRMRQALTEMIGSQATAAAAKPEPEAEKPKPDWYVDNADGTRSFFYSAEQQAKLEAWQAKQQEKTLQPIKAFIEEAQQERVLGRMRSSAKQTAGQLIDQLKTSPHFEPHKAAIRTKFQQYAKPRDKGGYGMSGEAALHRAYSDVLQEVVIPSLSRADQRALAASLHAKTGASSPNPARPGIATGGAKPPTTFAEAAERVLAGQR